jgi:hypothetical protein
LTGRPHVLHLLEDLIQIVVCRILQGREVDIGLKLLQPKRLEVLPYQVGDASPLLLSWHQTGKHAVSWGF